MKKKKEKRIVVLVTLCTSANKEKSFWLSLNWCSFKWIPKKATTTLPHSIHITTHQACVALHEFNVSYHSGKTNLFNKLHWQRDEHFWHKMKTMKTICIFNCLTLIYRIQLSKWLIVYLSKSKGKKCRHDKGSQKTNWQTVTRLIVFACELPFRSRYCVWYYTKEKKTKMSDSLFRLYAQRKIKSLAVDHCFWKFFSFFHCFFTKLEFETHCFKKRTHSLNFNFQILFLIFGCDLIFS